ncbi:MAG TPA: helix-turn-helix domain-containing protein, partial [Blastocatellia bacterium]|nr:helix-turn-helix domain-containing protein [Blastocatellia bacterium]
MVQPLFVRPLSPSETEGLKRCAESSNREEACRAAAILLSSEGKTATEIGAALGSHPTNIKKWIGKFNKDGLDGIAVKKRGPQGGPRPRFSLRQIQEILRLSETAPSTAGYRFKEWTPQKLATAAVERGIVDRISHVTVRQILKRNLGGEPTAKPEHAFPGNGAGAAKHWGKDESHFYRGEVALSQSHYESAAEHFYAALDAHPLSQEDEAKIRSLLSKALEELSKYEEAFRAVGKYEDPRLISSFSARTRARLRLRLGWVYSFLSNHAKAIASLNEARRLFLELGDDL